MIGSETCEVQANVVTNQTLQPLTSQQDEVKKAYDAVASAQAALLDKSIISIAGASFSITIGFIDKLIPLAFAKGIWMLTVIRLRDKKNVQNLQRVCYKNLTQSITYQGDFEHGPP